MKSLDLKLRSRVNKTHARSGPLFFLFTFLAGADPSLCFFVRSAAANFAQVYELLWVRVCSAEGPVINRDSSADTAEPNRPNFLWQPRGKVVQLLWRRQRGFSRRCARLWNSTLARADQRKTSSRAHAASFDLASHTRLMPSESCRRRKNKQKWSLPPLTAAAATWHEQSLQNAFFGSQTEEMR